MDRETILLWFAFAGGLICGELWTMMLYSLSRVKTHGGTP